MLFVIIVHYISSRKVCSEENFIWKKLVMAVRFRKIDFEIYQNHKLER